MDTKRYTQECSLLALFATKPNLTQPKYTSTVEYKIKLRWICTVELDREKKMNKALLHAMVWINHTNRDEPEEPETKKYILYESIYLKFKIAKLISGVVSQDSGYL